MNRPRSAIQHATTRLGRAGLSLAMIIGCVATVEGQSGFFMTFPQGPGNPTPTARGLLLAVDTHWVDSPGYRPVSVTVSSPTPTTADRSVTLRMHLASGGRRQQTITIEEDIDLFAGSTSATASISVPQYYPDGVVWWEVWVDGIQEPRLSLPENQARALVAGAFGGGGIPWDPHLYALAAGRTPPALRRTQPVSGSRQFSWHGGILTYHQFAANFPTRWLDYTCFDVVILQAADLSRVPADTRQALGRWMRTGGAIWVSDVGLDWRDMATIDELFRDSPIMSVAKSDDSPASELPAGWEFDQYLRRSEDNEDGEEVVDEMSGASQFVDDSEAFEYFQQHPELDFGQRRGRGSRDRQREMPEDSSAWYAVRQAGLGRLVAFRGPWFEAPPYISNRAQRAWPQRHGLMPARANVDFANWLIPGVGLAPVTAFRVLITVFVLVIGPLNYWLLRRAKQLHLLVLTVPVASVLVTSALFAYALAADGLTTRVRARSFAVIDQPTGEAASWSRLSYYSGLAPARGLDMPADVAVYPIVPGWNEDFRRADIANVRELEWTDDRQHLVRGWLKSRTTTQYLTIRARQSPYRLELTPAGESLDVANQLGSRIRQLLVIDDMGSHHWGEEIAPDELARLVPTKQSDALLALRRTFLDNEPELPAAFVDSSGDYLRAQRRQARRLMRDRFGLDYSRHRLEENDLNRAMAELLGLAGGPPLDLPPRSYVAVTETGPEVDLGVRWATEIASFHVVVGRW